MSGMNSSDAKHAEFTRLPRPGQRDALTGLSRTTLCELIADGHIQAKKLRKRGSLRGITLIVTDSLLDYLHALEPATVKGGEVK